MSIWNTMEKIRNAVNKSGTTPSSKESKVSSVLREKIVSLPGALLFYVAKEMFGDTLCSWVLEFMNWCICFVQQHWYPVPLYVINHLPLAAGCITLLLIGGALNSVIPVCKWGLRKLRS